MAKRKAPGQGEEDKPSKRPKSSPPLEVESRLVAIRDARDLVSLVSFRQNEAQEMRSGLVQFNGFLKLLDDQQDPNFQQNRSILLEYLRLANSKGKEDETLACSAIFQTWNYAGYTNHTGLLTTIPSVLAALLRTISRWEDFSSQGRHICKTLLQKENLTMVERGLTPTQQRPEQVLACLKLLSEVVSYDLGSLARALYRQGRRAYSLAEGCLSPKLLQKGSSGGLSKVRAAAVDFILANFRFQASAIKAELIGQFDIIRNVFQGIENYLPATIIEIIQACRRYILEDKKLSASAKSRFLSASTLLSLARLSRNARRRAAKPEYVEAGSLAYELLMHECLKEQNDTGEAPANQDENNATHDLHDDDADDEDDPSPNFDHGEAKRGFIRRAALAALLQELRPDANLDDRKLALTIFQTHPNTEPEYFNLRKSQYFDPPKLTATWVGYASLLVSILRLPPPSLPASAFQGDNVDVSVISDVVDSFLPKPLQREALERCFNQNSELTLILTVQITTAALQRLKNLVMASKEIFASLKSNEATLETAFARRMPRGSTILGAYRRCKPEQSLLKTSLARLLQLCYDTVPELIVPEKLDVSKAVAKSLQELDEAQLHGSKAELEKQQLESFMWISAGDPFVRWFIKPEMLKFSPFTTVLRTASQDMKYKPASDLAVAIANDRSIVQQEDTSKGIRALLLSLSMDADSQPEPVVFEFLDSCLFYLNKRALKYVGMLYQLIDKLDLRRDKEDMGFSPLMLVISEQWAFVPKSKTSEETAHIARWIARLLEALDDIGENRTMLRAVRDELTGSSEDTAVRDILLSAIPESKPRVQLEKAPLTTSSPAPAEPKPKPDTSALAELERSLDAQLQPPAEAADHPELTRWQAKDIEDAIDDGHVGSLFMCLSSSSLAVRRQALTSTRLLKSRLAPYKLAHDKPTATLGLCYWVVGQLVETAEQQGGDTAPLPSFVPAFAARALRVTRDPGHFLFAKVNRFVDARPFWLPAKLPKQWVDRIAWRAPDRPAAKWRETLWLLGLLRDGLRTPQDAALYFHANVFEPLLCRCLPPAAAVAGTGAPDAVWVALVRLLYAYASIEGGARTLLTRFALLAWIHSRLGHAGLSYRVKARLRCLAKKLGDEADADAMDDWSGGKFRNQVDALWENRLTDFF